MNRERSLLYSVFIIQITKNFYSSKSDMVREHERWHYLIEAEIHNTNLVDTENPMKRIWYGVDGKYYQGEFVPKGYAYRVYGKDGCINYGIQSLAEAIKEADDCLQWQLDHLRLEVEHPFMLLKQKGFSKDDIDRMEKEATEQLKELSQTQLLQGEYAILTDEMPKLITEADLKGENE